MKSTPIVPTYYVRHPTGGYSIAHPQPSAEQIAAQRTTYAQCDRKHGGGACEDPDCNRSADKALALLQSDAERMRAEMLRYLPVLEKLESSEHVWDHITKGLGIATLNGYRAALTKGQP